MQSFIGAIERRGVSPWTPLVAATFIAGVRVVEEHLLIYVPRGILRDPVVWIGHITLFYLALVWCITALVSTVARRDPRLVQAAVAAALCLGVVPPLIDLALYGAGGFGYAYQPFLDQRLPWTLHAPPMFLPWGETVVLWLTVGLVGLYVRLSGAGWGRTAVAVVGHYALILCFLVLLPAAALGLMNATGAPEINALVGVCLLAAVWLGQGVVRPLLLRRLGARVGQVAVAGALTLAGAALAGRLDARAGMAAAAMMVAAALFAWHNDHFDRVEDAAAGRGPGLTREDVVVVTSAAVPFWLTLSQAHVWPMLLSLLFLAVGFAYHADPLRLKCVFPLSYKTEAFLALLCVGAGLLAHERPVLTGAQALAMLLVGGGAALVAMLKDYKDLAADRQGGVRTVFVVCGARGWSARRTYALVAVLSGAALAVPPLWLIIARGAVGAAALLAALASGVLLAPVTLRRTSLAWGVALGCLSVYLVAGALALQRAGGV